MTAAGPGGQQRVLIVDDDETSQLLLGLALSKEGAHPDAVKSVDEALRALALARYDRAAIDVNLCGEDGLALCRKMREMEACREIPVAILTGYLDDGVRDAIRRAGADAALEKSTDWTGTARAVLALARTGRSQ